MLQGKSSGETEPELGGQLKSSTLSPYLKANSVFSLDTRMLLSQWHVCGDIERGMLQSRFSNQLHGRRSWKKAHSARLHDSDPCCC